ncbi:MAG: type II toxin-antitoxin system RatA family toxin [Pseudomonadota bacterium]
MPTHSEKRFLPYAPDEMFDLVADIESYPEFLPWCAASRVRDRRARGETEIVDADLVISFKVFREKFGSRVKLDPGARLIVVEYLDGPFRYLNNNWSFRSVNGGTEVEFFVDFEFRSRALQAVIGVVFYEAMRRVVRAFEARAAALYGAS